MTLKKKPRKRSSSSAAKRFSIGLRRAAVWLVAAGAVAFQATSCGFLPGPRPPSIEGPPVPTASTGFSECRQFFASGVTPKVARAPLQRELCFDAFAILHSGQTKTPVFVAQRLSRQSTQDAQGEKRTNRFFADARLPRAERAELSDYKGSGYARGHMAPAGDMPDATAMAQSFSLANMVPQNQKQNADAWSKIEQDTLRYALCVPRAMSLSSRGPCLGQAAYSSVPTRCACPPMCLSWSITPRRRRLGHIGRPMPRMPVLANLSATKS